MRVDDRVRKTIVYLGVSTPHSFIAYGTGFVVVSRVEDYGFQSVITARHVIERIQSDTVDLRINHRSGEAQILRSHKSAWHFHEDKRIDVAVCPSVINREEFDILHMSLEGDMILTEEEIARRYIGIGDEVYIAGMFVGRLGETKNIPIVRCGTIAAMPEEKLRTVYGYHHAYLIEARSIDGLSGSPVFIQMAPWRIERDGQVRMQHGQTEYFMGMLLGHSQVENPGDTIEIVQGSTDRPENGAPKVSAALNTGIGVVLPVSYVIEAADQPAIKDKRMARLKEKQPREFKPDSALGVHVATRKPKVEVEDAEETDEGHRERFKTLLDAAVKQPKSSD